MWGCLQAPSLQASHSSPREVNIIQILRMALVGVPEDAVASVNTGTYLNMGYLFCLLPPAAEPCSVPPRFPYQLACKRNHLLNISNSTLKSERARDTALQTGAWP